MALPPAEWIDDHVFIPAELMDNVHDGDSIILDIKKNGNVTVETSIRKDNKPAPQQRPQTAAPMALYLQNYLQNSLELLDNGFRLIVIVRHDVIEVSAEKKL